MDTVWSLQTWVSDTHFTNQTPSETLLPSHWAIQLTLAPHWALNVIFSLTQLGFGVFWWFWIRFGEVVVLGLVGFGDVMF